MINHLTQLDAPLDTRSDSLDGKVPAGPLREKWDHYLSESKLVSPKNKRRFRIIVVGTGLAGASAAATMAELGYQVSSFCFHDSPRRAHSVAAQGGVNGAKNYQNDGDSVWRLFYDTIMGGDFRSREANVYRLAEVSSAIIDQCVAQGVPFAREYGGYLANRSFGGAQVSRTFYCRGQTGQQLLLGAYGALNRQIAAGNINMHTRHEMLDLVLIDQQARGIVTRNLLTGAIETFRADAVVLATGGYSNAFYLSTNASGCNATAIWRAYKQGAFFANPCFTQIHPTCIPPSGDHQAKLTLMSESLRNDGRVWVPNLPDETRRPEDIPEAERDYFLERKYPAFGNLAPRDIASRSAKEVCDEGKGVGANGYGVYLDFAEAIADQGRDVIASRYGNLFDMYQQITGENPYQQPMRIFPAPHYTMGGLWVDYNLMSTVSGLFVIGEANFSDHGANRLGASALMQGLADGYFILPNTIGNYLADVNLADVSGRSEFAAAEGRVRDRVNQLMSLTGSRTVESIHRELGRLLWEHCGMSRSRSGLHEALSRIPELREEFWDDATVLGSADGLNMSLEKAGRVADFLELGELMCRDALAREESCGCHLRVEYQTDEGEAVRNDDEFCHTTAWEYAGDDKKPLRHQEHLKFAEVELAERSYK